MLKCLGVADYSLDVEPVSGHFGPFWQKGFFDHVLRSAESYARKWDYVRQNPVRAGLVDEAQEWPYQGEVFRLGFDL